MATPTAILRLLVVVSGRNLVLGALRNVSYQFDELGRAFTMAGRTARDMGLGITAASGISAAALGGLIGMAGKYEWEVVDAIKRVNDEAIEAMGGWEKFKELATRTFLDVSNISGVSSEDIASAFGEMAAKGAPVVEMLKEYRNTIEHGGTAADTFLGKMAKAISALEVSPEQMGQVMGLLAVFHEIQTRIGKAPEYFKTPMQAYLGYLNAINEAQNTMGLQISEFQDAWQYVGAEVAKTGTKFSDILAAFTFLRQAGMSPSRIGTGLRYLMAKSSEAALKLETGFEFLFKKMYGKEAESMIETAKKIMKERKDIEKEAHKIALESVKERYKTQKAILSDYERKYKQTMKNIQKLEEIRAKISSAVTDTQRKKYEDMLKRYEEKFGGTYDELKKQADLLSRAMQDQATTLRIVEGEYETLKKGQKTATEEAVKKLQLIRELAKQAGWDISALNDEWIKQYLSTEDLFTRIQMIGDLMEDLKGKVPEEFRESFADIVLGKAFGVRWKSTLELLYKGLPEVRKRSKILEDTMKEGARGTADSIEREWSHLMEDTLIGKFKMAMNKIKNTLIETFVSMLPTIMPLIEKLKNVLTSPKLQNSLKKIAEGFIESIPKVIEWIDRLLSKLNQLPDPIKKFMGKMVGAGLVFGPLLTVAGMFLNLLGNILGVVSMIRSALSSLPLGKKLAEAGNVLAKQTWKVGGITTTTAITTGEAGAIGTATTQATAASGAFTKLATALSSAKSALIGFIGELGPLSATLPLILGWFKGMGESVAILASKVDLVDLEKLKNGLQDLIKPLTSAAQELMLVVAALEKLGELAGTITIRGLQKVADRISEVFGSVLPPEVKTALEIMNQSFGEGINKWLEFSDAIGEAKKIGLQHIIDWANANKEYLQGEMRQGLDEYRKIAIQRARSIKIKVDYSPITEDVKKARKAVQDFYYMIKQIPSPNVSGVVSSYYRIRDAAKEAKHQVDLLNSSIGQSGTVSSKYMQEYLAGLTERKKPMTQKEWEAIREGYGETQPKIDIHLDVNLEGDLDKDALGIKVSKYLTQESNR